MNENGRVYNLDLLRIISMLMIVCLHLNSHGGMLVKYNALNFYGIFFNTLEVLCVVAVNIFVLISGYFLCSQQFRLSRIFKLMLQTLFYSWMCLIITFKFNLTPLDIHLLMRGILPVLYGNYWFVTAYVGMYALSPYINTFLNNISEQQHRATIFFMIICTSIINDCLPGERFLAVSGGYSVIWFVVLYIIAAYLRKYGVSCSKFRNIAIYILSIFGVNTVKLDRAEIFLR